MRQVEQDIKNQFPHLREQSSREIYFYNRPLFDTYVDFIRSHRFFVKEICIQEPEKKTVIKIVKKHTPTLKERGITPKDIMQRAQKVQNNEFYTRYEDVEKEIEMYPLDVWENKCVFCNCDDAVGETRTEKDSSAFALYFIKNFIRLKLKKLICTHYSGQMDLFHAGAKGYIFTKKGVKEVITATRGYTGDFADPISLKILNDEADIVCTNPPFSLAKEYWKTIIESGKKFLIISNFTNCKNKAYIHYFMRKKVWPGYNDVYWYLNEKRQIVKASGHWYTNLRVKNRTKYKNMKFMKLGEIPEKYKRYDDNKVLVVDNNYIPIDYQDPFAISVYPILSGVLEKGYEYSQDHEYVPYYNGKRAFGRVLIQKIPK